LPRFRAGDRVMLRVPNPGLGYGLLLAQDRSGWTSLRPNPRWRETEVEDDLVFPRQVAGLPPRFARLEGAGINRVIAVFTDEPLPASVVEALMACPLDAGNLNHSASIFRGRLGAGSNKCQMLSRRFLILGPTQP
jgi:hypothetical protein